MRANAMICSTLSLVLAVMAVGVHGIPPDLQYDVNFDRPRAQVGILTSISYIATAYDSEPIGGLSLILLQTTAQDESPIDSSNTQKLVDVQPGMCIYVNTKDECNSTDTQFPVASSARATSEATFLLSANSGVVGENGLDNFFFCISTKVNGRDLCRFYSTVFNMSNGNDATLSAPIPTGSTPPVVKTNPDLNHISKRDLTPPQTALEVTSTNTNFLSMEETQTTTTAISTTVSPSPTTTLSLEVTVTGSSSGEATAVTAAPSPTVTTAESSKSGGLSIAAKVGIALGALAFALILLIIALLFLRRKHARRNQPEQVMLTRSMHTDSFSRNLITEKEDPTASAATTPIEETALPIQRHSAVATYEPVPSASYAGAAAAIPRRKPTAATMVSTVSRGLSTTSGTSSSGARSPRSGEGFEQYHDVPIYGDARHVPQVFLGNAQPMQSPFLSEEGMTPEEVARLEEEERRIDAAIAEAERR
ncbi:hypothetical protein BKA64DRAFT_293172 [Cadophora sp. MPI-SDFR-AT-0126]|nr:hypothetical protein BKA64DRAFT_293172 [Leotiomycetes sp. MPI-SDFR-AT-0126]